MLIHFRRMVRQRLGQHFLADPGWREDLARAIGVSPHSPAPLRTASDAAQCWIEVGAGHGEMTEHLASTGAPVYAIELDPLMLSHLRRLKKRHENLTIIAGDILETDLAALAAGRRMRVYGNLPYYITSPILHRLFSYAEQIEEIHLVIQEEVALRLAAKPQSRDYGYLSVLTQLYTRPEIVLQIPPQAFSPPPEVRSALVTLRLPGERSQLGLRDEEKFLDFVKLCFSKKRKTLVNNLHSVAEPDNARAALLSIGIRPDARAEQLSLPQFAQLHEVLL